MIYRFVVCLHAIFCNRLCVCVSELKRMRLNHIYLFDVEKRRKKKKSADINQRAMRIACIAVWTTRPKRKVNRATVANIAVGPQKTLKLSAVQRKLFQLFSIIKWKTSMRFAYIVRNFNQRHRTQPNAVNCQRPSFVVIRLRLIMF